MKNRTIVGIICIVLAAIITFGVTPLVNNVASSEVDVVQVNKTITEGTRITSDDLTIVQISKQDLPSNAIQKKESIVGKYANTDLYKGICLIPDMFTANGNSTESVLENLDEKHIAISIGIPSFSAGMSSKLLNGDIISIIVSNNDGTFIPQELRYVKLITTTTSSGIDRDKLLPKDDGSYDAPATATLLVTPEQANTLIEYEHYGKLHLALVCRSNSPKAQSYLNQQNETLNSIFNPIVADVEGAVAE